MQLRRSEATGSQFLYGAYFFFNFTSEVKKSYPHLPKEDTLTPTSRINFGFSIYQLYQLWQIKLINQGMYSVISAGDHSYFKSYRNPWPKGQGSFRTERTCAILQKGINIFCKIAGFMFSPSVPRFARDYGAGIHLCRKRQSFLPEKIKMQNVKCKMTI